MKALKDEQGMILITVILLLMVVTLLGIMAINSATVDIQITGNLKRSSSSFSGAEAGIDLSTPIIEKSIAAGALDPTSFTVGSDTVNIDSNLGDEIAGGHDYDTDTSDFAVPSLGGTQVNVDIDRLYSYTLPGGAMEFASGYEGVGAAAAGGGVGVLYRINSQGTK
jgi:Tfp pilus assembly protein PilX